MHGGQREARFEEQSEPERRRITPSEFSDAINDYLQGTVMLHALAQLQLKTDTEGNIELYVINNLRMLLRQAAEMTPDEIAKIKFENLQAFLAQY